MPKKTPKNAFYFFMVDFKEEQRAKGINYGKMNEVADAAGPFWTEMPPQIRAKYEALAKKEKQKNKWIDAKFANNGVPLSLIELQEKELKQAEENERKDIQNMVKLKSFNGDIIREDFYVMDVNYYCKVGSGYLIGESTILRFNLEDGIREIYHEKINPGHIPIGYASDVKHGAIDLGLEPPDEDTPSSNYMQILANIIDYLKQKDRNAKILPPIFTVPEKILPVQDFIQQMCNRAGEDDRLFRVYRLDTLFFTLTNAVKTMDDEGFPKESLAHDILKKDPFKYTPGIGCAHHEESDRSVECTASRAKRWAYTVLDHACAGAGVPLRPGRHVPHDYDMDSILIYKDQKRGIQALSVAGAANTSLCNSSVVSDFNDSSIFNSSAETVKKEKIPHTTLRMPKLDFKPIVRPAPDLTENNFPKLTGGRGRGAGRGLAGSSNGP